MGFFSDPDPGFRRDVATAAPLPPTPPDAYQAVGAAFRQSNIVASLYNEMANSGPFAPDPSHNPLDTIRDTPYEQRHLDRFTASRSEAETRAIMRRIDGEESDRKITAAAGLGGVMMNVLAGVTDPTILLPGSIAVRAGRGGYEFTRAAVNVGVAGAVQAGVQESILQATQETRPLSETLLNVASSTVLAGLIGGAASRLIPPAERQVLEASLDRARADMDAHANPRPAELVVSSAPPLIPEPPTMLDKLRADSAQISKAAEQALERGDRAEYDRLVARHGELVQEIAGVEVATPSGLAQSAGAAATDIRTLEMPSSIPGTSRISATRFVLDAQSVAARRVMADTAETPYSYRQSGEGVAATQGPPVSRQVQIEAIRARVAVNDELDRLFTDYYFGADPPAMAQARAGVETFFGRNEGKMGYHEFKQAVSEAAMNGDRHEIPQVASAAQFVRAHAFEPWAGRAEKAIEGFKRLIPAEDESYFPHNWNKEKIKARKPEFTDRLVEKYREDQAGKAAAKERLSKLTADLDEARAALAKATDEESAAFFTRRHDEARTRIEEEIAAWEGKSVSEAKAAIAAREKYAADTNRAEENIGQGPVDRLEAADKAVDRAVKRILKSDRDLDDPELRAIAAQTVDRILGSPDGRLPYDAMSSPRGSAFGGGDDARGSLAKRQLNVTNAWAREWIEDDIEQVVNSHLRTFVPDVVLAERHGDVEMTQAIRAINDDYARLSDAARGNEKKVAKLEDERQAVLRRVAGVRDRIRGVYGWNPDMANLGRVTTALKQINNITSMGMSAIASISDFAGAPIRYGLTTAFADGWAPFLKSMVTANPALEKQRSQLRALGVGVDTALNLRQHAFDDIIDGYKPQSRIERVLQWTNDKFFVANLLAPLTDMQKGIAGSVAINEALRGVKAINASKATKAQIRNLADAGIDANMASRIHRQFFENGFGETVDGVHIPNTGDWTDQGARAAFEGAVARDVDIMVVSPGQEKPLLLSKPVGSLIFQFKSFPAAATERILISNLQRRDAKALSGVVTSLALGMLSYKINSMLGGKPVSDDPRIWVKEGISRSGLTGWLEEGNAMAAKLTRGTLDVHRLYGADKPLSRYASRSLADAFLGPTAGKLASIGQVGGAAATGEWGQSDTTALRRLMFFQNLAWLRGAINQVESGANSYFNIPEKAKN
jgi:hypothetical protein